MKVKRFSLVVILMLPLMVLAAQTLDKIVAIVNDDVITAQQLQSRLHIVEKRIASMKQKQPPRSVLEKQVLNQMIDEALQTSLADKAGITVSDAEVRNAIADIAKHHRLSVKQLEAKVTKEEGITRSEYHDEIKREMVLNEAQRSAVAPQIKVTDVEVKNYLANTDIVNTEQMPSYHIKDIMIALPDEPTSSQVEAGKARAERLLQQIKKSKDFSAEAIANSAGMEALHGGDLGWRHAAELPDLFAVALKGMKPGDVSPVLRAPNGFHIIKLVNVKGTNLHHTMRETHVRHILVKVTPVETDKKVKAKLNRIRSDIKKGASFAKLAKQYSDDPGSAALGGDLDWTKPGDLDPRFAEVMNQLKVHQISKPFKTQFGWHIVEVLGHRKVNDTEAYKERQVKQMLFERKFQEGIQSWVQQLRSNAYVKMMLE